MHVLVYMKLIMSVLKLFCGVMIRVADLIEEFRFHFNLNPKKDYMF